MKKILFVASVDEHIRHFHYPYLKFFKDNNYIVDVASNGEEILKYVDNKFNVPFQRTPISLYNIKAYKILKEIINKGDYDIIHCHTPIGGVVGRLASILARKNGTKIIYTAHGFHFYRGAPIRNWLLFYPIEKLLANFTDSIITINQEDFDILNKWNCKCSKHIINGIGVDIKKFSKRTYDFYKLKRKKYNIYDSDIILVYIAELSKRKNQKVLINMMKLLVVKNKNFKLFLVGKGNRYDYYKRLINKLKLTDNIKLLGYRNDIPELLASSDIVLSSSKQEGLPLNIMEAMAIGLPIIASDCRGNRDLIQNNSNGYLVQNTKEDFLNSIYNLTNNFKLQDKFVKCNLKLIKKYDIQNVLPEMINIYRNHM